MTSITPNRCVQPFLIAMSTTTHAFARFDNIRPPTVLKCLSFLALITISGASVRSEDRAVLNDATGQPQVEPKKRPGAERADAENLYLAAAEVFSKGHIEYAGFLFYAAQIRARIDLESYEPVGTGGDSPGVALTAVRVQGHAKINPAIMRDREAFARVLARIEKWSPAYDSNYQPGWEFKSALNESQIKEKAQQVKTAWLKQMQEVNQLLQDDEWFDAFKTTQDYDLEGEKLLLTDADGKARRVERKKVSKSDYQAALARIQEIEKSRGLKSGLFPTKADLKRSQEEWKRSRKTDYKVHQDKVMYEGQEVAGADPATFQVLDDVDYAKDARHVYVVGYRIKGADPATFRIIEAPYARDATHLYCGNLPMKIGNIDEFQVVETSGAWSVSFDKSAIVEYRHDFGSMDVTRDSPAVTGDAWGKDNRNWYFGPAIIEGADYESFRPIGANHAEDKTRGYFGSTPIDKVEIPNWARDEPFE